MCTSHFVRESVIKEILLETIRYACASACEDEASFVEAVRSASTVHDQNEAKQLTKTLRKNQKRFAELDRLIKKVYEDNAIGKLSDRRYELLSSDYEKEQDELDDEIERAKEELARFEHDTDHSKDFIALAKRYTDFKELTPVMINEFIDKVLIHKAESIDGERVMEIEVYLNFIGKVELPVNELSPEEIEARRADLERRMNRRNYMNNYRKKQRMEAEKKKRRAKAEEKMKERIREAEKQAELAMEEAEKTAAV